ncbi:MAG TPA: prepilin-type N-terminal cleavage/methylation domain-containing protein [Verrucomicrobiae bacterium]|nr:prepilin-type N-terminal cleavage/methylation domain-containing protein [Verrucomicrobiae bacterium]
MNAPKNTDHCVPTNVGENSLRAFTLVEIMIVVAIIGLLVAVMVPSMVKARKQSQGRRIVNDARELNAAISQWALEKNKTDGDNVNTTEAATYLKGSWPKKDILGNNFKIGTVGTNQITIAKTTKKALTGVGIDWGPF